MLLLFRDGSEKNQDGTNALCALLHQLFTQKQKLLRHALPDFEHNKTRLSGLFETLWSIFLRATTDSKAGSIICVLDALDECDERTRTPLLKHIGRFRSDSPEIASVKFILTSRPNKMIVDSLWEDYPDVLSVRLMGESEGEMSTIQKEISLVIDKKVENFRKKRQQYNIHDDTHDEVSKRLAQIENRTYLWVSLIFPELEKNVRSNQGNLLQVIKALPSTVQEAYEKILNDSTDTAKARKLLHIVLAGQKPFTLQEMNTALAITEDCVSIDDLELEPEPTFPETVRELCGLFISVSDSRIYLIHQTAGEFLLASSSESQLVPVTQGTWRHSILIRKSHFELAKICLLYLHLSGSEYEPPATTFHEEKDKMHISPYLIQRQALRKYSANFWNFHTIESDSESVDASIDLVLSVITPGSTALMNWTTMGDNAYLTRVAELDHLSIAALLGLKTTVKFLLEREEQLTEGTIEPAAAWTIRRCPHIFSDFLGRNLNLKAQFHRQRTFLHDAAYFGRIEVAQLLIEAGAAVNSEDEDLREPLPLAVRSESKAILCLLIEKGARINHRDRNGLLSMWLSNRGSLR